MKKTQKLLPISSAFLLLIGMWNTAFVYAGSAKVKKHKITQSFKNGKIKTEAPWLKQSPFSSGLKTRNPFSGPGEPLATTATMLKLLLIDSEDCTYWGIQDGITEEAPNALWYFDGSSWCPATASILDGEEETSNLAPQCIVRCEDGSLIAIHSDNKVYIALPEDIDIDTEEECSVSIDFTAVVPGDDDPDFSQVLKSSTGNKIFGIALDFKLWHHTSNGWLSTGRTLAHITNQGGCAFLTVDDLTTKIDPTCQGNAEIEEEFQV
jgi:hypothetical protein